jgi:hypothetical protein
MTTTDFILLQKVKAIAYSVRRELRAGVNWVVENIGDFLPVIIPTAIAIAVIIVGYRTFKRFVR